MKSIILTVVLLFLIGCGYLPSDVTSNPIFRSYLNQDFSLQEPFTLRLRAPYKYQFEPYGLVPLHADPFFGKVIEILPEGTRLNIKSIKMIKRDDRNIFYAIGNIYLGNKNLSKPFEIVLGSAPCNAEIIILRRMPWDDRHVPERREVRGH